MLLEISNIGRNTARQVSLTFQPDPLLLTNRRLSEIFGSFPVLHPGERFTTALFNSADNGRVDKMFPTRHLTVQGTWRDDSSLRLRSAKVSYRVDQLFGTAIVDERNELFDAIETAVEALLLAQRPKG